MLQRLIDVRPSGRQAVRPQASRAVRRDRLRDANRDQTMQYII